MKALVSAEIEAYATAHSMEESDVCRQLRAETLRQMDCPQMLVGPLEGAFLKMVTRLVGARHVLEIGMFTGYSALCFAEAVRKTAPSRPAKSTTLPRRSPTAISGSLRMGGRSRSGWAGRSRRWGRSTGRMTSSS